MKSKRILNLNICAELKLEMTEELENLYDKFCEEEKAYFEDEDNDNCYKYTRANENLYDGIMVEVKRLYPNLDIHELAEYYEDEEE